MPLKRRALLSLIALVSCLGFGSSDVAAGEPSVGSPTPSVDRGAGVFQRRCALCHGTSAMGEGQLPLSVGGYPSTNLLDPSIRRDLEKTRQSIIWGGAGEGASVYSPPWGDELTWTEVESVVLFVAHLRENPDRALALLREEANKIPPSVRIGRRIFVTRCVLCHGASGEGDGRMAKVISDPLPFDLTESRASDEYLARIISEGGAGVGRSDKMPPWEKDLSQSEIRSVILYVKTLRD